MSGLEKLLISNSEECKDKNFMKWPIKPFRERFLNNTEIFK